LVLPNDYHRRFINTIMLKPVNETIQVVIGPIINDTDFKTRITNLAWNAAGMTITLIRENYTDQSVEQFAITPTVTTWLPIANGYYQLEIPDTTNDTEGVIHAVGYATGVLPFRSVVYSVVPDNVFDDFTNSGVLTWLRNMIASVGPNYQFTATALAQAAASGVQVLPLSVTVGVGNISSFEWIAWQYAGFAFGPMIITDALGSPINLQGKTLTFIAYKQDNVTVDFTLAGSNITISGANHNQVTITSDDTYTTTARDLKWALRNDTDDTVIARGSLSIKPVPDTPT
jgi:hypothetical protein